MKSKFNLKNEYKEGWKYLKESRNFIYLIVGIFLISSLIGFFVPPPDFVVEQIMKFIEELLGKTQGMSMLELVIFIFANNIQSSFFGIIFGFLFGIFPMLASIANGYLIGFVGSIVVEAEGLSSLWRLVPHGIFELPAIFISFGLGLKAGMFIFQKDRSESFRKYLWNSLRVFILIVLPLLIIAAIIEGVLISLGM
ncbi:stage II sporulation protein M [Candidatus Pacearchaeota archaeon]|nr:stage II sporulation protein M [Candidatus Pacearchaeota archaeon]